MSEQIPEGTFAVFDVNGQKFVTRPTKDLCENQEIWEMRDGKFQPFREKTRQDVLTDVAALLQDGVASIETAIDLLMDDL